MSICAYQPGDVEAVCEGVVDRLNAASRFIRRKTELTRLRPTSTPSQTMRPHDRVGEPPHREKFAPNRGAMYADGA
jgi:hypothetical protein